MKGYKAVRGIYHTVVPEGVRDRLYDWSPAPVKSIKRRIVAAFERDAEHDDTYDQAYYEKFVEPTIRLSAETMAESIARDLSPRTAVDIGCGTGVLLAALRSRGVDVRGLELADAAIAMCHRRGLDVSKFDIEHDSPPQLKADVAVSMEVAEHLPERCADRFVDVLAGVADTVVLTAAVPGQGGTDHVNEQPNEYWIAKFTARGFGFDQSMSLAWRQRWKEAQVANCFAASVMVFKRTVR